MKLSKLVQIPLWLLMAGVLVAAAPADTAEVVASTPEAAAPVPAAPGCVPSDSCGCSVRIEEASCPAGGASFFHELADGSPLQFDAGEGIVTATSGRAQTNVFSHEAGDSWTETWRHGDDTVEIRYSPGESTCTKAEDDEPCEYFDVRADVRISGPRGAQAYSGTGTCGC